MCSKCFCLFPIAANAPKADAGFAEKLTAQIVNNLQVKISKVHVRYEDSTTTGLPFSFGITLDELELCTTDQNWEKCYMTERLPQVFKIASLSCLSCYFNCKGKLYINETNDNLSEKFQQNIARKNYKPESYYYGESVIEIIYCVCMYN